MDYTDDVGFKKSFTASAILATITFIYSFFSFIAADVDSGSFFFATLLNIASVVAIFLCLKLEPSDNTVCPIFLASLITTISVDAIGLFAVDNILGLPVVTLITFLITTFPYVFILINELCHNAINTATKVIGWICAVILIVLLTFSFFASLIVSTYASAEYIISVFFSLISGIASICYLIGCMSYSSSKMPITARPKVSFGQQPNSVPQQPSPSAQQPYDPAQRPYAAQQSNGTPRQSYAPQQPYGMPQQPYAPQQPYGAPQQPYGMPQQPYGAPQQPYNPTQQQSESAPQQSSFDNKSN